MKVVTSDVSTKKVTNNTNNENLIFKIANIYKHECKWINTWQISNALKYLQHCPKWYIYKQNRKEHKRQKQVKHSKYKLNTDKLSNQKTIKQPNNLDTCHTWYTYKQGLQYNQQQTLDFQISQNTCKWIHMNRIQTSQKES